MILRRTGPRTQSPKALAGLGAALLLGAAPAAAQNSELLFSLDFQGPLMGLTDPVGVPITDGDLLRRRGGVFDPVTPQVAISAQFLDAYTACQGHLAGDACGLEINAFSFGRDARLLPGANYRFAVYLSVDEFAVGRPSLPGANTATIFSEAQAQEAASDVFIRPFQGGGPFQTIPGQSGAVADGNGQASLQGGPISIGLGLVEPLPPTPGTTESGSNVDGLDVGSFSAASAGPLFFSLQGGFASCNEPMGATFDAASVQSLVSGQNARSADILFAPQVGQVGLYASAQQLGLDIGGIGTDDIDGLAIFENGTPGYQPATGPYSWLGSAPTDLVLFSLRCGSGTVGRPDSISNIGISEGDILIQFDSSGNSRPGIWIPAETLGLETIMRGGMSNDELDGFDLVDDFDEPFLDCNMNGVEDVVDILGGTSIDCDGNGIPDECELPGSSVCDCAAPADAPCGNTTSAGRGCENNVGLGAQLTAMGTSSFTTDVLTLQLMDATPGTLGIVVTGNAGTVSPSGNGGVCLGSPFRLGIVSTRGAGEATVGPGIFGAINAAPMSPGVMIGSTVGFQIWYRDIGGPCGGLWNWTNAWQVLVTP